MKCLHCGKPVTLLPTATERARACGGTPESYERIFTYHSRCTLELRAKGVSDLMNSLKGNKNG